MGSATIFIIGVLLIGLISSLLVFGNPANAIRYFKTEKGKNVFVGIITFVGFGVATALISVIAHADDQKGEFFAYGEVYLGIDHPLTQSPQCVEPGPNKHITSNGGIRVNLYQSADKNFELNSKYTHHSCAFNTDRNTYDAVGIELTYRLW